MYTYDYLGDITSFNNAGLYSLTESYNSAARLTSVTSSLVDSQHPATIINNISYGAFGTSGDSLGNGISENFGFSARGALNSYSAGTAYSFTLGLAADSLVTSGNDSVNGNWSYSYDQFDRIASASKTSTNLSWAYDRFGNRWQQNGGGSQYTMDTNNHINNPDSGISYDVLGNVLNDGLGHSFTYDAENRVTTMNGTSYVYDAFGRRVNNGGSEFLYDLHGNTVAWFNATTGGWTFAELYAGGRHLATYSGGTTNFLHSDWLGTKRAMTSISGSRTQSCTSLPFGDSLNCTGIEWGYPHFADMLHDGESNTEHTQFRQLSTTQSRWLSPDPYTRSMDLTNPQSLNRYAYVLNNPLNATDPTGLCDQDFEDCDGMLGGLLGGGVLGGGVFGGGGSGDISRGIPGGISGGVSGAGIFGGETLGLPTGLPIQNPGLLGAILPDLPQECDFGPCPPGVSPLVGVPATGDPLAALRPVIDFGDPEVKLIDQNCQDPNSFKGYSGMGTITGTWAPPGAITPAMSDTQPMGTTGHCVSWGNGQCYRGSGSNGCDAVYCPGDTRSANGSYTQFLDKFPVRTVATICSSFKVVPGGPK